jgi:hypothetical protein
VAPRLRMPPDMPLKDYTLLVLLVCCFRLSDTNAPRLGVRSATDEATRAIISRSASPIIIDGVLDEPDWKAATPIGEIRQREPHPGEKASESTEVNPTDTKIAAKVQYTFRFRGSRLPAGSLRAGSRPPTPTSSSGQRPRDVFIFEETRKIQVCTASCTKSMRRSCIRA